MTRITGLFEKRSDAERAVEHLVQELGIEPTRVKAHATGAKLGQVLSPKDQPAYEEGLRRGGILVAAEVEQAQLGRAMQTLNECGAVLSHARPRSETTSLASPPSPAS